MKKYFKSPTKTKMTITMWSYVTKYAKNGRYCMNWCSWRIRKSCRKRRKWRKNWLSLSKKSSKKKKFKSPQGNMFENRNAHYSWKSPKRWRCLLTALSLKAKHRELSCVIKRYRSWKRAWSNPSSGRWTYAKFKKEETRICRKNINRLVFLSRR